MGQRETKCPVIWQLRQIHVESRHETSPFEHWPQPLAEASPLNPVWGIRPRVDDPLANDPRQWKGKKLLGEELLAVREAIRDSETPGLLWPVPYSHGGNAGIHEMFVPASSALPRSSF